MKIGLIAVGRLKAGPERELAQRYHTRAVTLGRTLGLAVAEVAELAESRAADTNARRNEEGALLLAKADAAVIVAFDERGQSPTSDAFATRLADWRDRGTAVLVLAVGGADGLSPDVRQRAAWTLSFGAMTLPHQIARVLVLEQLYRAMTIMSGHPYHRA